MRKEQGELKLKNREKSGKGYEWKEILLFALETVHWVSPAA